MLELSEEQKSTTRYIREKGASQWLQAHPSSSLNRRLSALEFHDALGERYVLQARVVQKNVIAIARTVSMCIRATQILASKLYSNDDTEEMT
ncbi:hypothetical protein GJ496_005656 [Pomphorhynchus laevis]|nr:hypothetical protein GJ496_005656 [Pomphorhynchus laevis]